MEIQTKLLDPKEATAFALRALYHSYGYQFYKMSKFEPYDLSPDTDLAALQEGYVSVVPIRPDYTALDLVDRCAVLNTRFTQ